MRFRWFIILLVSAILLVTLSLSGTAIYLLRSAEIEEGISSDAETTVESLAERTEGMLASVEQSLILLTHAKARMSGAQFSSLLVKAMASQPLIRTLYFIGVDGKTDTVWTEHSANPRDPNLLGIDFSYTPLYRSLENRNDPVWSDKFVSTLSGSTFIGVGFRSDHVSAIAELDLSTLLETVQTASGSDMRIWVLDRIGEVLVDNRNPRAVGVLNIRNEPVVQSALSGGDLPVRMQMLGQAYYPASARSETLGWLFLVGIPAGLQNPAIRGVLTDILKLSASFLLVAFILSPVWLHVVSSQVNSLRALAGRIADGEESIDVSKGVIREFNDLAAYLESMAERIRERENSLRDLNQELEQRVADRTRELEVSNQELRTSLENNTRMRDLLVDTEKLAALGRLVAGVAHEMNTPIGNAIMAITTLKEGQKKLLGAMAEGLRKSDLDRFLDDTEQGLKIAERNVDRAAELVSSFKHVASDQTSEIRRRFDLSEMVREVLLTLHPMLKRSPHTLLTDFEDGLVLDSFPGVIGQILTNLITNALAHAWEDGVQGHLSVIARGDAESGRVRISVVDDGKGIPEPLRKKIFEPFFTTRMGQGGTGLGLNIAYNGASNVLGGTLSVESEPGKGSRFDLDIPLKAPVLTAEPHETDERDDERSKTFEAS